MIDIIDIHCHVLPLADDGPEAYERAVQLLRQLTNQGVREVCCTPCLRKGAAEISDAEISNRFEILKKSAAEAEIQAELYLSREYYADELFYDKLNRKEIMPLGRSHILLELPGEASEREMHDHIEKVTAHGYTPLLAHPERCRLICEYPAAAERLVKAGAQLQLNAGSILGREGLQQKNLCSKLLKKKLVYAVASEAHDPENIPPEMDAVYEWLVRKCGANYTGQLMYTNPLKILKG